MKNERIVIQPAEIKTLFDEIKPQDTSTISKKRTVFVQKDTKLQYIFAYLGGKKIENEIEIVLNGQGAKAEVLGIIFGWGDNQIDIKTTSRHKVPDTKADVFIKAVLKDRSKLDYRGLIKIVKGAQKTDSYLSDHTLLLSNRSKAVTIPSLEIEVDDVKASHEATVGRIDKEQTFYLMSRGLSKKEAEKLIVQGFFNSVVGKIVDSNIREKIVSKIEKIKL